MLRKKHSEIIIIWHSIEFWVKVKGNSKLYEIMKWFEVKINKPQIYNKSNNIIK